jgi:hypothetical protein
MPLSLLTEAQKGRKGAQTFMSFFETGSSFVAQAGLKFTILLPSPPECWDHIGACHHPQLQESINAVFCYILN